MPQIPPGVTQTIPVTSQEDYYTNIPGPNVSGGGGGAGFGVYLVSLGSSFVLQVSVPSGATPTTGYQANCPYPYQVGVYPNGAPRYHWYHGTFDVGGSAPPDPGPPPRGGPGGGGGSGGAGGGAACDCGYVHN